MSLHKSALSVKKKIWPKRTEFFSLRTLSMFAVTHGQKTLEDLTPVGHLPPNGRMLTIPNDLLSPVLFRY